MVLWLTWVAVTVLTSLTSGGPTIAYGNTTTSEIMTSEGACCFTLSGLSQGTTYHFRAKAVGHGTCYGADKSFTTLAIPLVSMVITPDNPEITSGRTQQFIATGTYSDNSTADITASANWTSDNTSVATIDAAGLATGIAAGNTTITAVLDGISANTTLTVICSVEVNSGNTISLKEGQVVPVELFMAGMATGGIPVTVKGLPDLGPANGLAGFTFDFIWDPAVIHMDEVVRSLDAAGAGWSVEAGTPNNTTGNLTSTGFRTTYDTNDIILLYLSITAVGSAGNSTSINVTVTSLGDKDGSFISAVPINAPVEIVEMVAETSISQALDADSQVVIKVNIDRIKNPSDNSTANIYGGIDTYTATANATPASGIEFVTVNGVSPFDSPSFNATTGVFSVAASSPIQPSNTAVAEVIMILTGDITTSVNLNVVFQVIGAVSDPGLNILEEYPNSITFQRGNVKEGDGVDIFDALFIAQYIVGQRTLEGINALNAASVKHDDGDGDKIDIFDALFIAQYIVGQRDAFFQ
ncbi:Ig-like domain-containing protein [Chloroflexota bacterium]